jgi:putative peptide zinc metalloprotease protein
VIVSTLREDTVASAVWLVDGLRERGYQAKVSNAVTLLAAPSRQTDAQLHQRTRAHFESLTREVLDVPYDSSLVAGGPLSYQALQPETREAWLRAAAAVMHGLRAGTDERSISVCPRARHRHRTSMAPIMPRSSWSRMWQW